MAEKDIRDKVLAVAKDKNPGSKKFHVNAVVEDFLSGTLATVEYIDNEGDEIEDIAYVKDGEITLFADVEAMAKTLRGRERKTQLERLLQIGGISGILAVGMLFTICYLAVFGKPVPEVLSNGLGLVIGFYFGNQVAK